MYSPFLVVVVTVDAIEECKLSLNETRWVDNNALTNVLMDRETQYSEATGTVDSRRDTVSKLLNTIERGVFTHHGGSRSSSIILIVEGHSVNISSCCLVGIAGRSCGESVCRLSSLPKVSQSRIG